MSEETDHSQCAPTLVSTGAPVSVPHQTPVNDPSPALEDDRVRPDRLPESPVIRARKAEPLATHRRMSPPPDAPPPREAPAPSAALPEFRKVYDSSITLVYAFVRTNIGSCAAVDDVVQEAFIAVLARLHTFRMECAMSTWVLGITLNKIKDYRRRAFKWNRGACDIDELASTPASSRPDTEAEQAWEHRAVWDALSQLSVDHQGVIILHHIEELTAPEIAAKLNLTEGTVYSRLHHARRQLETSLGPILQEPRRRKKRKP